MAEKIRATQEQQPRRFKRQSLLTTLTDRAGKFRQEVVFNRPDLVSHAELLALATELSAFDNLSPAEQRHLRKMVSLKARQQPQVKLLPGDQQFWETLEGLAGNEWQKAQSFADDLSDLPKSWQAARQDIVLLSSNLSDGEV